VLKTCRGKGKAIPFTGLDRPWRLEEGWASHILRQSSHEGGKFVSPMHRPPLTPENIPDTHFC
jgi:hypothetical protein